MVNKYKYEIISWILMIIAFTSYVFAVEYNNPLFGIPLAFILGYLGGQWSKLKSKIIELKNKGK